MALTQEFISAVSQGNLLRVKIMLKDSLLVDTSFEQFNEMIAYTRSRSLDIWISDNDDDEVFSNSPDDLNAILAGLVNNFSHRRVNHLKGMITLIYPPKPKQPPEKRKQVVIIQKTRAVIDEYNGIGEDKLLIGAVMNKIKKNQQIEAEDIEKIKQAASDIVKRCEKINGK